MNTMRGRMPLAITQFLSARYQNAGPDPGLQERRDRDAGQLAEAPLVDARAGHRVANHDVTRLQPLQIGDAIGVETAPARAALRAPADTSAAAAGPRAARWRAG